jgi:hypothetical protein
MTPKHLSRSGDRIGLLFNQTQVVSREQDSFCSTPRQEQRQSTSEHGNVRRTGMLFNGRLAILCITATALAIVSPILSQPLKAQTSEAA